jgi:hypothetical protein
LSDKLSDDDVLILLKMALDALGGGSASTIRADTALTTARTALAMLALSLKGAIALNEEELRGVIEPRIEPSPRQ